MSNYQKIITMSLYNRPNYTQLILEALSKCIGIKDYKLLIFIEPGNKEVIQLANNVKFCDREVRVNPKVLGCVGNIYQCLKEGFNRTDFNIHCEDDILFAPDALLLAEWAKDKYKDDKDILTIGFYNRNPANEQDNYRIRKLAHFHPWGWATWKDRWEEIDKNWIHNEYPGWDCNICNIIRKDRKQIQPLLSRSQNIGAEKGVHVASAEWHKKNHHTEYWANNLKNYNISNFCE